MATTRRTRTSTRGTTTTRTKSDIIEIGFDDYEGDGNAYMGDDPRPGVYGFRLVNVERHTSKNGNKGIRWQFECTDPAYAGWRGYMYSDTDPDGSKWKTQQILKAVQNGQEKAVKLDLANPDKFLGSCTEVVGRVVADSWEDEETGEVRSNAKVVRVVAESAAPKRKARTEDDDDNDDGFDDDGDDDEGFEEDDDLRADLGGKTLVELKKLARDEYGFSAADVRGLSKDDLIDMIVEEADGEDEGSDDDADDDGDDADSEDSADEADEDEDEEEEEPAPRTRRRASSTAKAAPAKKAAPARRSRR